MRANGDTYRVQNLHQHRNFRQTCVVRAEVFPCNASGAILFPAVEISDASSAANTTNWRDANTRDELTTAKLLRGFSEPFLHHPLYASTKPRRGTICVGLRTSTSHSGQNAC